MLPLDSAIMTMGKGLKEAAWYYVVLTADRKRMKMMEWARQEKSRSSEKKKKKKKKIWLCYHFNLVGVSFCVSFVT